MIRALVHFFPLWTCGVVVGSITKVYGYTDEALLSTFPCLPFRGGMHYCDCTKQEHALGKRDEIKADRGRVIQCCSTTRASRLCLHRVLHASCCRRYETANTT